MGIFDFLFKSKSTTQNNNEPEKQKERVVPVIEEEYKGPVTIAKTNYSVTSEEKNGIFERIEFKVAGVSFYQAAIKKAIKEAKENSFYFDEKYEGMTNKNILEDTYDEPVFEYEGALFPNCTLQLEPNNEHDSQAIAVYVESFLVGYVPQKNFSEGKQYLYDQLTGGLETNQQLNASVILRGGKYKVNRNNEKIDIGESDYKLDGHVTIKTERN